MSSTDAQAREATAADEPEAPPAVPEPAPKAKAKANAAAAAPARHLEGLEELEETRECELKGHL